MVKCVGLATSKLLGLAICPAQITDVPVSTHLSPVRSSSNFDESGHRCLPDGRQQCQISMRSARTRASSTSTPRYRTVFSILKWPSRICCTQISGCRVDHGGLGAPHGMGTVVFTPQPDHGDPLIDEASILPRAHRLAGMDPAWEDEIIDGAAPPQKPCC